MDLRRVTTSAVVAAVASAGVVVTAVPAGADPAGPSRPPVGPGQVARQTRAMAVDEPGAVKVVRDGITLLHWRTAVSATPVTGAGLTRSDFDGDGRDDVAVGSDGGVFVSYSSAPHRDRLSTEMPSGGCVCFGIEMATGNFDGDWYDDLAIADSGEVDLRKMGYHAGAVWLFRGGPGGLQVDTVIHLNQSTSGVPGTSEEGNWFGEGLAAGDINGDRRDELAIGIPGKAVNGKKEAGVVVVLNGDAGGVTTAGARWIHQNTSGVPDAAELRDHFGSSVAIGKINKDRFLDLVVGAPQEDDGRSFEGTGLVTQFWGSTGGVSTGKVTSVSGRQATRAAKLTGLYLWYLGGNLAIGDTNGDGFGEVVDGAGGAEVSWDLAPGAVVSLAGRSAGLSATGVIVLSQDSTGVADSTESEDWFGAAIAVGDVTGDGLADVLVGVPGEDFTTRKDAGEIVLLRGSRKGLTGVGSQTLTQSSPVVPDSSERGDQFAASVTLLNLDGVGGLDAVIGAPGEEVPGDLPGYASGTITRLAGTSKGLGGPGQAVDGRSVGLEGGRYGFSLVGM